ncbi:Hypothetical predicted protein, partial [Paramuricea clavata]
TSQPSTHHEYSIFPCIGYCNGIGSRSRSEVLQEKRTSLLWKWQMRCALL